MPEKQRKQLEFIDDIYNKVVLKKGTADTETKSVYKHHEINEKVGSGGPVTEDKENVFSSVNHAHVNKIRPYNNNHQHFEVDSVIS